MNVPIKKAMGNIDELNEEMKHRTQVPFQRKKGMLSYLEWEELYLQRPITIHTDKEDEE